MFIFFFFQFSVHFSNAQLDNSKFIEDADFVPSQRGSIVLYYNGRRFTRDGMFQDTINWRCCYFRDKCRARAVTREINGVAKVRITNGHHTCTPKRQRKPVTGC